MSPVERLEDEVAHVLANSTKSACGAWCMVPTGRMKSLAAALHEHRIDAYDVTVRTRVFYDGVEGGTWRMMVAPPTFWQRVCSRVRRVRIHWRLAREERALERAVKKHKLRMRHPIAHRRFRA